MNETVIIIGASGHGKVVADIVECSGDKVKGFLDDAPDIGETFIGIPVLGTVKSYKNYPYVKYVIAIGNAKIRERIAKQMQGTEWYTAIHPRAVISQIDTEIGEGSVVMANAVINAGAKIGKHCIINTEAVVEHDNILEDFVHVSVGAKLAGTVHIGRRSWIGIGAAVGNNLSICGDCMIGAGGVVVKNIEEAGTYVGIPVKKIREREFTK